MNEHVKTLLLLYLSLAAMWDVALYKIPNALTAIPLILLPLFITPQIILMRLVMALVILVTIYKLRAIGGGDVKLIALLIAYAGHEFIGRLGLCLLCAVAAECIIKIGASIARKDYKRQHIPLAVGIAAGYYVYYFS